MSTVSGEERGYTGQPGDTAPREQGVAILQRGDEEHDAGYGE